MRIPCTIMRGGTSKGVLLRARDLPAEPEARDAVILKVFGSPDRRQIDGLGGADPLTSKLAIVGPPSRGDADIDYTFGQVLIEEARVDYGGYCGNVAAAVAAFAVDEGFVEAGGEAAGVRIHCTNMGRTIRARVPLRDGRAAEEGEAAISGVPGTGAPIDLDFADTVGSATGRLLPKGPAFELPGFGGMRLTVVDAGTPMVFVDAAAFGVGTADGPEEIDGRADLLAEIEDIRTKAARLAGLAAADGRVGDNYPLVGLVRGPADYRAYSTGAPVAAAAMDVWSREIFLGRTHKAYGVSEAVCTAAAAAIAGTVVEGHARAGAAARGRLRIGHPNGVIEAAIEAEAGPDGPVFRRIAVVRTARRILDGHVYVRGAG
jgi:2-methylaconitate cis-trans-isomerase PrpF